MYLRLKHRWLILAASLIVLGNTAKPAASLDSVFIPYRDEIRNHLKSGWQMRLPSNLPSVDSLDEQANSYQVEIVSSSETFGLIINLYYCDDADPSCLVGSFSVGSPSSALVEDAFQQHQSGAAPITLSEGVRGYFLEGTNGFSSVMWEQEGLIYTVRFLSQHHQNILYMAHSMARSQPLRSAADPPAVVSQFPRESPTTVLTVSGRIFDFYLEQIKQYLPQGAGMRLPAQVLLTNPKTTEESQYRVKVSPMGSGTGVVVNLLDCDNEVSCLVGSFSVETEASLSAQETFEQHQAAFAPITLGQGIQGYLLESVREGSSRSFSSVMWKQDNLFYTVKFPTEQRQNLLYMALSMATGIPINQTSTSLVPEAESIPIIDEVVRISSGQGSTTELQQQRQVENTSNRDSSQLPEGRLCPGIDSENTDIHAHRHTTNELPSPDISNLSVSGETFSIAVGESTIFRKEEIIERIKNTAEEINQNNQLNQLSREKIIEKVVDAVTKLYIDKGYINSKAIAQERENLLIELNIIEGKIGKILIQELERVELSYLCDRIQLASLNPLNIIELEEQLKLLKEDPLFKNIEASLTAPETQDDKDIRGISNLIITVSEANPITSRVNIDNYSPPSVGAQRMGITLGYNTFNGDKLAASYSRSISGGSEVIDLTAQIPINPMEGTVQLGAAFTWSKVTQSPFDELNIRAENQRYEIVYYQPWIRTPREQLTLSLGLNYNNGQTFIFDRFPTPFGIGPDEEGVSRTSVIVFGQNYLNRDPAGAWLVNSQFNFGTGLFDVTTNDPPIPDGYFFSWLGQVSRSQILNDDHTLIIKTGWQLTPNTLLPVHQFLIGGGQSVRGYRQNARSGDNGLRLSVEDRITVVRDEAGLPKFLIAPFIDMGIVWNTSGNPNTLSDQTFLLGAGIGFQWERILGFKDTIFRIDYGFPFISLEDRGDSLQDYGLYFRIYSSPDF